MVRHQKGKKKWEGHGLTRRTAPHQCHSYSALLLMALEVLATLEVGGL